MRFEHWKTSPFALSPPSIRTLYPSVAPPTEPCCKSHLRIPSQRPNQHPSFQETSGFANTVTIVHHHQRAPFSAAAASEGQLFHSVSYCVYRQHQQEPWPIEEPVSCTSFFCLQSAAVLGPAGHVLIRGKPASG